MICPLTLLALLPIFAQPAPAPRPPATEFDSIFVKGRVLTYRAYKVTAYFNPATSVSLVTIKRHSRVLARVRQADNFEDSSQMGLAPLLGGKSMQLIVQQSSEGAHCCLSWRIYDLYPAFRLIFDSDKYFIGDGWGERRFEDIDKDGACELIHSTDQFAYFDGLCFACSPLPTIVYKYDTSAGRYYPANPQFRGFLLRGMSEWLKKLKKSDGPEFFPLLLHLMLDYIYAGERHKAWVLFDKEYGGSDKKSMRRKIRDCLSRDAVYRFVYRLPALGRVRGCG